MPRLPRRPRVGKRGLDSQYAESFLDYVLGGYAMGEARPKSALPKRDLGPAEVSQKETGFFTHATERVAVDKQGRPKKWDERAWRRAAGASGYTDKRSAYDPDLVSANLETALKKLDPVQEIESIDPSGPVPIKRIRAVSPGDVKTKLRNKILETIREIPPDTTYREEAEEALAQAIGNAYASMRGYSRVYDTVDQVARRAAIARDADTISRGRQRGAAEPEGYDPEAEKARAAEGVGLDEEKVAQTLAEAEDATATATAKEEYSTRKKRADDLREITAIGKWTKAQLANPNLSKAQRAKLERILAKARTAYKGVQQQYDYPMHQKGEDIVKDKPDLVPFREARAPGDYPLQTGPASDAPLYQKVTVKLPSGRTLEGRVLVSDTNPYGKLFHKDEVSTRITPEGYTPVKSLSFGRGPYLDYEATAKDPKTGQKILGEALIELPYDRELERLGWVTRQATGGYRPLTAAKDRVRMRSDVMPDQPQPPDTKLDLFTGDAEDLIGTYPPKRGQGTIITGIRPTRGGVIGPKGRIQPADTAQPPGTVVVRVPATQAKDGTFQLSARAPRPAAKAKPPLNLADPPKSQDDLLARLDALLSERRPVRARAETPEDYAEDAVSPLARLMAEIRRSDEIARLSPQISKRSPEWRTKLGRFRDQVVPNLTVALESRPLDEILTPEMTLPTRETRRQRPTQAQRTAAFIQETIRRQGTTVGKGGRIRMPQRPRGGPLALSEKANVPMTAKAVKALVQAMRTGNRNISSLALPALLAAGGSLLATDEAEAAPRVPITTAIPWTAKPALEWQTRPPQVPISTPGGDAMRNFVDQDFQWKQWARGLGDEQLAEEIQVLMGGGQGRALDYARPIVEAMHGLDENELTALDALLASRAANRAVDEGATKAQRLRQEAAWLSNDPRMRREARARIVEARALERAGQGGRLAPASVVGQQKPEEIEAYLLSQYGPDSLARVTQLERRIYDSANAMLGELERAQILTPAEAQAYRDRGDYLWRHRKMGQLGPDGRVYELKRLQPELLLKESQRRGRRLSTRQEQIIHKLLGAEPEREYDRPLRNALTFIDDTVREVNKNYLARRTAELGLRTDPDQWRILKSPNEAAADKGVVAYQHLGKTVYVEAPPLIADLLSFGNLNIASQAMRVGSAFKRWFQAMAATANPAFGAVQVIKDIPVALARPEYAKYQGGLTGADLDFFQQAWLQALKEAYQDQWTPGRAAFHKSGAYLHEIARPGVPMDRLGLEPPETSLIRRIPQLMEQGFEAISGRTLEPIEEATKRASFELLQRKGFGQTPLSGGDPNIWSPIPIDQLEAAYQARLYGGSPDFNQRGRLVGDIGTWYMFLNPQIQGITRTVTLADLSNPQNLPKLATWVGSLSALLAGTSAWNYQFVNPDTGRPEPEEWTEADKAQAIQIILPEGLGGGIEQLSDGRRRWKAIKIPLSHEFQPAIVPARMLIDQLTANPNANAAQSAVDFGMNFVPGNVQMDLDAPLQSLGRRLGAGANPVVRLPAEYWTNKQFFTDTPIVGRRVENLPAKFQSTARTTPTSKAIGEATGLSPDVLDWLVRGVAPGLGEMAYTALDPMLREPTPPQDTGVTTETLARLPVAGTLLRRFLPSLARGQASHSDADYLYELAPRTQAAIAKLNQMAELRPTELEAFQAENPNLVLMAGANTAVQRWLRAIREVDDEIELLQQRPDLPVSAAERTERLNQLAVHRGQLMMQARQELEALGLQ